ncbi:hypothetical protein ZWY2020_028835 [Hordeum vulgare]|nr:hypothetical protein ZWY2020_028835 [Hordeum vulgare]
MLALSSSVGALTLSAFVEPLVIFLILVVNAAIGVEQGSLTGETNSVNKTAHTVPADDTDILAKDCMVFAGTTIVNGSAVYLVVHTGMATEIGKIHSQIHEALQEDDDTPLKNKLNEFGEALTKIIGLICILVWLIKCVSDMARLYTDAFHSCYDDMIVGMANEYFKFLNKYLATFDGSTDEADAIGAAKEEAVAAIIEFVKLVDLYQVMCVSSQSTQSSKASSSSSSSASASSSSSLAHSCHG